MPSVWLTAVQVRKTEDTQPTEPEGDSAVGAEGATGVDVGVGVGVGVGGEASTGTPLKSPKVATFSANTQQLTPSWSATCHQSSLARRPVTEAECPPSMVATTCKLRPGPRRQLASCLAITVGGIGVGVGVLSAGAGLGVSTTSPTRTCTRAEPIFCPSEAER